MFTLTSRSSSHAFNSNNEHIERKLQPLPDLHEMWKTCDLIGSFNTKEAPIHVCKIINEF